MTEIERALLIGTAESLAVGNNVFYGFLVSPSIAFLVWIVVRDLQVAFRAVEAVFWLSSLIVLFGATYCFKVEKNLKSLRIDRTVMAYGLTGKYPKVWDSRYEYAKFDRDNFQRLFRLKRVASLVAFSMFSVMSACICFVVFLQLIRK
jgi:hypothetical protein